MVLKTHLEPFREPLMVPPVGQPNNLFFLFLRVNLYFKHKYYIYYLLYFINITNYVFDNDGDTQTACAK